MTIATAWSNQAEAAVAFEAAYDRIRSRLGGDPSLLVLRYTEDYDPEDLRAALAALPSAVRAYGGSTCRGVITEEGLHLGGPILGMLGVAEADSRFGVATRPKFGDPRAAAAAAVRAALDDAGRPGELPDLVLLSISPGGEESALAGIADVVGSNVPVFGDSAADNGNGENRWSVLSREAAETDGVSVVAIFAAFPLSRAHRVGYAPTALRGVVTEMAAPRVISRIDGRPAAEVYDAWCAAAIGHTPAAAEWLAVGAPLPFGREVGHIGAAGVYVLSQVSRRRPDGGLAVLTDIAVGDSLTLMVGSRENLLPRAARIVSAAIELQCADVCRVSGALVTFCAGLMMTLGDGLPDVAASVRAAMSARPFLATFSFGEQGFLLDDRAVHGNLMISALVLGT